MIRDAAASGRIGGWGSVVNLHFVLSALSGLGGHGVPLYVVSEARPSLAVPGQGQGVYCMVSLRVQHRLAAALFQRDHLTCAVSDVGWPYRLALPVFVQACTPVVERATTASVVRTYGAASMLAARRVLADSLSAYYRYVDKCTSFLLYHLCLLSRVRGRFVQICVVSPSFG